MKPSNTGRDWLSESRIDNIQIEFNLTRMEGHFCFDREPLNDMMREVESIVRKELAAKVEGAPRFAPITKDGPGFSHYAMMDEYSGGDWVRLSDMRSILNEAPNAE